MAVFLRRADLSDAEDVLKWRNDETTRKNSFSGEVISLSSHLKWFENKLSDKNCRLYIMMDEDRKVGNIRVDIENGVGEISYMIAPDCRRKGYGKKMIALVENEMPGEVEMLMGLTLKENQASGKCFLANGYAEEEKERAICYTKKI